MLRDELVEVGPCEYELPQTDDMRVPGKVFVSKKLFDAVEEDALMQVKNAASIPGIVGHSIAMPDMHVGYGFCVGGICAFDAQTGVVSPGAIGFDINCGVRVLATNLDVSRVHDFIEELLEVLSQRVPAGVGLKSSRMLSRDELREVLVRGSQWAVDNGFGKQEDVVRTEEGGCFVGADPDVLSQRAFARGLSQLGTLGAGNHFLEIQVVDEIYDQEVAETFGVTRPGQVLVMIHTGSRGLGHQVCTDYLRRIEQEMPEIMDSLVEKNLAYAPLSSNLADEYLSAMKAAANFAFCNRQMITHHVRSSFKRLFPESVVSQVYDITHNIAKFEEHEIAGQTKRVLVHRKGATRAFAAGRSEVCEPYRAVGQPVLLPGSMGSASYVLVGTPQAMNVSFGSSAHGAGRVLSRTAAKKKFSGKEVSQSLKKRSIHVHANSSSGVAEEAPGVYKDVDEVVSTTQQAGIATPVVRATPLGVLKG